MQAGRALPPTRWATRAAYPRYAAFQPAIAKRACAASPQEPAAPQIPQKSRACSASLTARCAVSVRPTCAAASSFLAGAPSASRTALPRPSPARPLALLLPRRRGPLLCFLAGCGIPPACPAAEATPAAHTRSATATTRLQLPPAAGNLSRLAIIIDQRPAACSLTS